LNSNDGVSAERGVKTAWRLHASLPSSGSTNYQILRGAILVVLDDCSYNVSAFIVFAVSAARRRFDRLARQCCIAAAYAFAYKQTRAESRTW
jgi:hypothetical protein